MILTKRVVAVAGCLVLLVACGGGAKENGLDKLSADKAMAKVKDAATSVSSVHVVGHFTQSGRAYGIDLHLKRGAGRGTLTLGGGRLDIVRIGGTAYFRGDSAALQATGASAAEAKLVAGRWLKGSATTGQFAALSGFLDITKLFDQLLTPSGTVSSGGRAEVHGTKTLKLVDSGSEGGTLYVALEGKPLPLRVVNTSANSGTVDFTDYDEGATVTAPEGAVDISQVG